MEQLFFFVLQVLDSLSFGWFSRGGTRLGRSPDPDEVWSDERRRLGLARIEGDALLGRIGTALTPLRPSGKVELDRRPREAVSESGFIEAGTSVEVVGRNGFALIVREESGAEKGTHLPRIILPADKMGRFRKYSDNGPSK